MRRILLVLLICQFTYIGNTQVSTSFGVDFTEICAPGVVQLSDSSFSSLSTITQWEWRVNGSVFSTLENPGLFLNIAGSYDLCLKVTDGLGNQDSLCINNFLTAYSSPLANFSNDISGGCNPQTINFSDLSILGDAPLTKWRWDFGDGNIDTLNQNPVHNYTTNGTFDVTLIVTDSNGCTNSALISNLITIVPAVTASIIPNIPLNQCGLPSTVNFNGSSNTPGATYTWYFEDNTFQNGQNISKTYLSSGCFTPTLTVFNGYCSATATLSSCITVSDVPVANFTLDDNTSCSLPFTPVITNLSTGQSSNSWNFGDGNTSTLFQPSHSYTSYQPEDSLNYLPGEFPFILTVTNSFGCISSDTQMVYISDLSASILSPLSICAPDTFALTANSLNISSAFQAIDWQWTADNLVSTNGFIANVFYPDSGSYNSQVIITDNIGCTDTANRTILIGILPEIDSITTDTNNVCRITGISFEGFGSSFIEQWYWEFSDTTALNGQSVHHSFQDTGYISGFVTAFFRGCASQIQLDSFYILPPIALFRSEIICDSLNVSFFDASTGAHQWQWDFGDTTTTTDTSTLKDPYYIYPDTGTYSVKLTVYNDSTNCPDTFRLNITLSKPVSDFTIPDTVCVPAVISTNNLSSGGISWYWYTPGSDTATRYAFNRSIYYKTAGIYPVTLYTFDINGCQDSLTKFIYLPGIDTNIIQSPIPACRPATVTFTDSSAGIISPIISWQWGTGSTTETTSNMYLFPGPQQMPLTLTNDLGCIFDLTEQVNVGGIFMNFNSARDICIDNSFAATAIVGSPINANAFEPFNYIWDYGDGSFDTLQNITTTHTYANAGVYDICLHVIDSIGCITSLCKPDWLEVHDPSSLFTADTFYTTCPPLEVNFNNLSLSGTQWNWSFGDGSVSGLENPTHVYSTPGFYDVILEVIAIPGCSGIDTIEQMIQISGPTGNFDMPPANNCAPYTAEFIGYGNNVATYTWLFGNGDFQSNITNTTTDTTYYTYTTEGSFVPVLIIDDGMGCQIPIEQDTIHIHGPPLADFISDSLSCKNDSVQYQIITVINGTMTAEWYFEGGFPDSSGLLAPSIYYPDTGNYDVRLIIWEDGCSDTLLKSHFLQIKPLPEAAFGLILSDSCLPVIAHFSDSSTTEEGSIIAWHWDFGNGQTAISPDSSSWYTQTDTYDIQLISTNTFGCKDTITKTIHGLPPPTAQISADSTICYGDTIQLIASGGQIYSWLEGSNLSDSSIYNPTAVPYLNSIYTVEVRDSNHCADSISTMVSILSTSFDSLPDYLICFGDSITISLTNATNPTWAGDSLSCYSCLQTSISPYDSSEISVQYLNIFNCPVADTTTINVVDLRALQAYNSDTICQGDSLQLNVSGNQGLSVEWLPDYALSSDTTPSPYAYPSVDTIYIVQVKDGLCNISDSINITVLPPPQINATGVSYCEGDSGQLSAFGSSTGYLWTPTTNLSNSNISNPYVSAGNSGQYIVTGGNFCGIDSSLVNVTVYSYPVVNTDSVILSTTGSEITLNTYSNQINNFSWSPDSELSCSNCPDPSWTVLGNEVFYVTITNTFGCSVSDSIIVQIQNICTPESIFIPNAFSPDNDGHNDILYVRSGIVQNIEVFQIYNRWGQLIFESNDMQKGWDGQFKQKPLAPDVYGYFVVFSCPFNGEKILKKGNVTILR